MSKLVPVVVLPQALGNSGNNKITTAVPPPCIGSCFYILQGASVADFPASCVFYDAHKPAGAGAKVVKQVMYSVL